MNAKRLNIDIIVSKKKTFTDANVVKIGEMSAPHWMFGNNYWWGFEFQQEN